MNPNRTSGAMAALPSLALLLVALAILVPERDALAQAIEGRELPVHRIPNIGMAAEFYFSPDGKSIIGTAKRAGDDNFHVYTLNIDGTDIRRINDRGEDACSYFFPDGKRIVWTSTRDRLDLPKGNYSDPLDYPQGAVSRARRTPFRLRQGAAATQLRNLSRRSAKRCPDPPDLQRRVRWFSRHLAGWPLAVVRLQPRFETRRAPADSLSDGHFQPQPGPEGKSLEPNLLCVMARLVPAIYVFDAAAKKDVDARDK